MAHDLVGGGVEVRAFATRRLLQPRAVDVQPTIGQHVAGLLPRHRRHGTATATTPRPTSAARHWRSSTNAIVDSPSAAAGGRFSAKSSTKATSAAGRSSRSSSVSVDRRIGFADTDVGGVDHHVEQLERERRSPAGLAHVVGQQRGGAALADLAHEVEHRRVERLRRRRPLAPGHGCRPVRRGAPAPRRTRT